ncbi:MAG: TniQ family protein [Nodosilinea sp. WJT8-NPBG4]|jgi:uncharacterized C2H2 Zn-finger protein|nr:TniQ family protein [Nodosilinea sp. WJT8-NPBG4]
MNEDSSLYNFDPWCIALEPFEGESISHYLGRVERANEWTSYLVGKAAGIGSVITRWKRFHLNPFPTPDQLTALASLLEISPARLAEMVPKAGESMKPKPIRLCGACFAEVPCHKIEWQYQSVWKCDRHNLKLLSKCPNCEAMFKIPALWEHGRCSRCHMLFKQMQDFQKAG